MMIRSAKTLLVVEDNPGDARLLGEMLREDASCTLDLVNVTSMIDAEIYLAEYDVEIILLDLGLPDASGLDAVRRAHTAAPNAALVVLSGLQDELLIEQSLREGVQDYLIKGQMESRGLLRALSHAIERKRLERLKDEFVSTVSHELRTPLTSIAGSLGLLVGGHAGTRSKLAKRLLHIAYTNSKRLVRLVDDILDIEKLEAGRAMFDLQKVDVYESLEQSIEANRVLAEIHDVRIRFESGGSAKNVRADESRLAQVIANLLSNAIKFSVAGSEVLIVASDRPAAVRISVRDHGVGVPLDFKPRLFQKFAQADGTNSRSKGGTGLGLSIVRQIVSRMGGDVGFEDTPGGGATFYIELPAWDNRTDGTLDPHSDLIVALPPLGAAKVTA